MKKAIDCFEIIDLPIGVAPEFPLDLIAPGQTCDDYVILNVKKLGTIIKKANMDYVVVDMHIPASEIQKVAEEFLINLVDLAKAYNLPSARRYSQPMEVKYKNYNIRYAPDVLILVRQYDTYGIGCLSLKRFEVR